jgi:hypothetical protein
MAGVLELPSPNWACSSSVNFERKCRHFTLITKQEAEDDADVQIPVLWGFYLYPISAR